MPRIAVCLFMLLLVSTMRLNAQQWEVGAQLGASGYQGDLNQRNVFQVSGIAAGLSLKYNFNGYLSLKASYIRAQIEGADSTSKYQQQRDRNLSFFTPLNELSLVGEFNFFEYLPGDGIHKFTPFIYGGIAAVNYKPQAMYRGDTYDLAPLMTEGQAKPYKSTVLSIPIGAGIKYNFWRSVGLTFDIGYRTAMTDYLDDVSGYYAPRSVFSSQTAYDLSDRSVNKIGRPGTQRGDLRNFDTYMVYSIGITYTILNSKCYYR